MQGKKGDFGILGAWPLCPPLNPPIVPGRGLTRLPARPQGSVAVVDYTVSICSWLLFRSRLRFDLKLFSEVDDMSDHQESSKY